MEKFDAEKKAHISIHAPRVGSDHGILVSVQRFRDFNPRSPCGERPTGPSCCGPGSTISIHAPRVGSDDFQARFNPVNHISIHAPRVGSDTSYTHTVKITLDFNPRSPCGERRLPHEERQSTYLTFQSTLPVWGATNAPPWCLQYRNYFNPRSPCGERQTVKRLEQEAKIFQSTLPVWGATTTLETARKREEISIHAPRVGSDRYGKNMTDVNQISIHAPRVGSDLLRRVRVRNVSGISIHAPRVGSDGTQLWQTFNCTNFNPRSPCGERPATLTTRAQWDE